MREKRWQLTARLRLLLRTGGVRVPLPRCRCGLSHSGLTCPPLGCRSPDFLAGFWNGEDQAGHNGAVRHRGVGGVGIRGPGRLFGGEGQAGCSAPGDAGSLIPALRLGRLRGGGSSSSFWAAAGPLAVTRVGRCSGRFGGLLGGSLEDVRLMRTAGPCSSSGSFHTAGQMEAACSPIVRLSVQGIFRRVAHTAAPFWCGKPVAFYVCPQPAGEVTVSRGLGSYDKNSELHATTRCHGYGSCSGSVWVAIGRYWSLYYSIPTRYLLRSEAIVSSEQQFGVLPTRRSAQDNTTILLLVLNSRGFLDTRPFC